PALQEDREARRGQVAEDGGGRVQRGGVAADAEEGRRRDADAVRVRRDRRAEGAAGGFPGPRAGRLQALPAIGRGRNPVRRGQELGQVRQGREARKTREALTA